jgi:hypothetical protein
VARRNREMICPKKEEEAPAKTNKNDIGKHRNENTRGNAICVEKNRQDASDDENSMARFTTYSVIYLHKISCYVNI